MAVKRPKAGVQDNKETVWRSWCATHSSHYDRGFMPDPGTVCSHVGCEDPAVISVIMLKDAG